MTESVARARFEMTGEFEPQRVGIREVKLSLLAPEMALLPANTPASYVFDVYGPMLTESVVMERLRAMLIAYQVAAGEQARVLEVSGEDMWLFDIMLDRAVAEALPERLRVGFWDAGVAVPTGMRDAYLKVVTIFTEAVRRERVWNSLELMATCEMLYDWWRDEVCPAVRGDNLTGKKIL